MISERKERYNFLKMAKLLMNDKSRELEVYVLLINSVSNITYKKQYIYF